MSIRESFSSVDDRFDRLPKWAQHEITKLRSDVAHYQNKLAETIGIAPSPIEIDRDGVNKDHIPKYTYQRDQWLVTH